MPAPVRFESPRPPGPRHPRLDSFKNPQPRPRPRLQKQAPDRCINPDCTDPNTLSIEDGKLVCQACGTVADDSPDLITDLQYGLDNGRHIVHGHHVAAESGYVRSADVYDRNRQISSLEHTNLAGKRYAIQICSALQISPALQEAGMQVFRLASSINFIQGRRTKSVAAVALYIACRSQRENPNQYMLIDFSDVLQLNVFHLGKIYSDLVAELRMNPNGLLINPINPEDLILRFAQRLEFGAETMRVANDAVRIVQRMNRDWMTPGRRPAGICGAALIIAAKMNNFRRTSREMVYVVKVNEATLSKRLEEFKGLESSGLTVDEFRTIELERNADPPAFLDGQKRAAKKMYKLPRFMSEFDDDGDQWGDRPTPADAIQDAAVQEAPTQQLPTPANTQQDASEGMPPPARPLRALRSAGTLPKADSANANKASDTSNKRKRGRPKSALHPADETELTAALTNPFSVQGSELQDAIDSVEVDIDKDERPARRSRLTNERDPATVSATEAIADDEFADDPEVSNCLLNDNEVAIKTRIWTSLNSDWLRTQAAKQLKHEMAVANGTYKPRKMRQRRRRRMGDLRSYAEDLGEGWEERLESGAGVGNSAAEAVERMMKRRAFSDKINYQMLREVYTPSAESMTASRRTSVAPDATAASEAGDEAALVEEAVSAAEKTTRTTGATQRQTRSRAAGANPRDDERIAQEQAELETIAQELEAGGINDVTEDRLNNDKDGV